MFMTGAKVVFMIVIMLPLCAFQERPPPFGCRQIKLSLQKVSIFHVDAIVSNSRQIFLTMPAKGAGTHSFQFTTECMQED